MRTIGEYPDVDHWARRLLTDCLDEATRVYWLKRAAQLEASRPRPDDFAGRSTIEERRRQWRDLTAAANACRARAGISPIDIEAIDPDVENVWQEVA